MTITRFFDKTILVQRLETVSGSKRNFTTTATVDGAFQEVDRQSRVQLDLNTDRAWVAYVDIEANINKGDRVVIESQAYKVVEVTQKDYGINQHLELLLVEYNKS